MSILKNLSLFTFIISLAVSGAAHAQPEKEESEKPSKEDSGKAGKEEIEPVTDFTGKALPPHEEGESAERPAAPAAPLTPSGEEEEIEPVTEFTGEALPPHEEGESAARPAAPAAPLTPSDEEEEIEPVTDFTGEALPPHEEGEPARRPAAEGAPIIPGTEAPADCPPCELSEIVEYIFMLHSVTCSDEGRFTCRGLGDAVYYFSDARRENTVVAQGASFSGAGEYTLQLAYKFNTPEGIYLEMSFERQRGRVIVAFNTKVERPADLAANATWSDSLRVFGAGPGDREVDMTFQYTVYPVIAED